MTDFKELRGAPLVEAVLQGDLVAELKMQAIVFQKSGAERMALLLNRALDRLEAAERDAERLRKLTALIEWDGNGYWLPDLCIRERACGAESCPRPTLDDVRAAIDAMKDQQP